MTKAGSEVTTTAANQAEMKNCTAKTLAGCELMVASELEAMSFRNVRVLKRAVQFESDLKGLYLANLNLRAALSILVSISEFHFRDKDDFIRQCSEIEWEKLFDIKKTFSVRTTVFSKEFSNTNYPALLVKDSVADRFRNLFGKRPSVDKERPDVVIDLYVSERRCSISLNSSGNPLYLRNYRNMPFEAPMNECLAAGLVLLSGWDGKSNFNNPMCGSGTIVAEATMFALGMHPQKLRNDFAFMNWKNYNPGLFDECRKKLISKERKSLNFIIQASDNSNRALSITRNTLSVLGIDAHVQLKKSNFLDSAAETENGTIMLNPPYGERLVQEDILSFYSSIGSTLKFKYIGHEAWIFSADTEALNMIGLKAFRKYQLYNGKIPCKFQAYQLFEGKGV